MAKIEAVRASPSAINFSPQLSTFLGCALHQEAKDILLKATSENIHIRNSVFACYFVN